MVLYALVSDASIGYLFLGGVVPGLLMAPGADGHRRHRRAAHAISRSRSRRRCASCRGITWRALPALLMPVVLLGGIYGGVMTPTEAAAVAAAYAFSSRSCSTAASAARDTLRCAARQRAHDRLDRHADRRRAGLQLRRHRREHSADASARSSAAATCRRRIPDPRQHHAAGARLPARRHDDPAGRRAGAHPDRAGARHRHGAFRRRRRGQHHARADHAALRAAAVHHDANISKSPLRAIVRDAAALPVRHDRVARR